MSSAGGKENRRLEKGNNRRRSVWTALTVPTFKMRIGQTFVVVVCLVLSLVAVGSVILMRSVGARKHAENSRALSKVASDYHAAVSMQSASLNALGEGDIGRAEESGRIWNERLSGLLEVLKGLGVDGTKKLAADIGRLSRDINRAFLSAAEAAGRGEGVAGYMDECRDVLDREAQLAARAEELAALELERSVEEGKGLLAFGITGFTVVLAMTAIMGVITMTVAYRGISGVVRKVINEVNEIARGKGDLTARVNVPTPDVHGELADAINAMVYSLRVSMLEIRGIAEQLSNSADSLAASMDGISSMVEEVTSAAEQISTGSEDQARKVEQTSLAMGEVSRSLEGIADRARVSSRQSSLTADLAAKGGLAAEEVAEVMRDIYRSVSNSEGLMKGLGERFTQIGIIIDVITDIADQTNLLALNAAIEAARAGEHGKGFSVVAGEVRKLAENSKRSAEQISHLIREITAETEKVAASMTAGTVSVESGLKVSKGTEEALEGIMASSRTAADAVEEISSAIQTISDSTDKVFDSISDIAAIAEQAAASTEEVAATMNEQRTATEDVAQSSIELARLAAKLQELTEGFKL